MAFCIGAGSNVGLLTPLVYPLMIVSGTNPFVGGAAMTLMQCLGGLTSPIGMALFAIMAVSGVKVKPLFKAMLPIIFIMFIWALFCVSFPDLFTFLIPTDAFIPIP